MSIPARQAVVRLAAERGVAGGPTASRRPSGRRRRRRRDWRGLLFVGPAVALVIAFFLVPLAMTLWMSLHDWPLLGTPRFVGLGNYERMLGDAGFWDALRFTGVYTAVITVLLMGIGMGLALMVERPGPMVGAYRTAFFVPVVIGFASASLLWFWLSNVDSGLFSPLAERLGLTEGRVNLLADYDLAFWSIVTMVVWKTAGFTMVLLMSGLQAVPRDYHEAARIDGANAWQRFRWITAPLVRRAFALALVLSVAGSVLAFDQFYIVLGGGPYNQTITAVYWIFNQSFVSFRLGYGAALSVVLLAILVALSALQLWLLRDPGHGR